MQIYQNSIKEKTIEMQIKSLETRITAFQKQLEKIEEAEGKGIEQSEPMFKGLE